MDNISKVSEKVFYQIHQRLIEIYQSGFISWLFAAKDCTWEQIYQSFHEDLMRIASLHLKSNVKVQLKYIIYPKRKAKE